MAIQQTATDSFKTELAQGVHNFGPTSPDTFKIALYDGQATIGPTTAAYSATNEVTGTGYVAGGETLVISQTPTSSSNVTYWSFDNAVFTAAVTARGALIYNATQGNKSVAVLDFGADKTSTTTFTVQFPVASYDTAILRIA